MHGPVVAADGGEIAARFFQPAAAPRGAVLIVPAMGTPQDFYRPFAEWLAGDPTGVGDTDVLILGDLNSYAKEDPIRALEDAGYTNLVDEYLGEDAYSYVFDGQWGYLDHALASATMRTQVDGVAEYHINADEPSVLDYNTDFKTANLQAVLYAPDEFRVSDHDPVIVGLSPKRSYDTDGFEGPLSKPARAVNGLDSVPTA